MANVYEAILNAYKEVAARENKKPSSILLSNSRGNAVITAFFNKKGDVESVIAYTHTKHEGVLAELISKYGGADVEVGMKKNSKDMFKIRVRLDLILDGVYAELQEKMKKEEAHVMTDVLGALGISYKMKGNEKFSIADTARRDDITAERIEKAMKIMTSVPGSDPYIFSGNIDRKVSEILENGEKQYFMMRQKYFQVGVPLYRWGTNKKLELEKLQSMIERDPDSKFDGFTTVDYKFPLDKTNETKIVD